MLTRRRGAVFWLVVVAAVVGVVVLTDVGRTAIDTKPQLYLNPDAVLASTLSAWQTVPALGQRSYESGLLLPSVVATALQAVGLPPWLIMRVLRVVLVLVGMTGAAWLARRVVPEGGSWAPRTAAVVYLLHPYVLVAGATLPVLWPWALLPWALGCIVLAVRSARSWPAWAVAAGVSTFAMAGQNAGSVVVLQMAVAVPVVLWWSARSSGKGWRRPLEVLEVLTGSVLALSAYWLLPGVLARGAGAAVVAQTESDEAISAVSSWSEVVRGLGLWPLYGTDGTTPWVEPHVALITVPLVVLAGFALLASAWWATATADRMRLRLAIGLTSVAALVMVGSHPWADPPPVGAAWKAALEQVSALGLLRTTNKAGAALVVGVALLSALAVATAAHPRRRASVIATVALVAVLPAWTGGLFVSTADVPEYWEQATRATDVGDSRVWLLPGQTNASYVWSDRRPDDVVQGLYEEREAMVRTTVANSTPQGASLLAGLDRRLQEGNLPPRALAAVSRYLGVGSVVVRGDVDNASVGGADPAVVAGAVAGSQGLSVGPTFGAASERTQGQPPVAVFTVDDPVGQVTAMQLSALVTVVGDATSLPDLAQLGILDGSQPFALAADADGTGVGLLGRSSRIVLTDTNLRAEAVPNRLTEDRGPLLAADEDADRMAGLWTADDQSVRLARGWRATASGQGSAFRPLPWSAAENAVDDDPRTAWFAGDFGTAIGSRLTVDVGSALAGDVEVHTASTGDAEITGLVMSAGGSESNLGRSSDGVFVGTLPDGSTEFSLRVTGVSPAGSLANVGISEVHVGGLPSPVADVLRTPLTLTVLMASAAAEDRARLASRPLDVVLSRRLGKTGSPVVEEPSLDRVVELAWDDSFTFRGLFRLGTPMPETALDEMEGAPGDVRATSSSQAFGLPTGRASMAMDGDEGTGWLPAEPTVGEEWRASFSDPVPASEISLVQPDRGRQLTEVVVRVDGVTVRSPLQPGRSTIPLPAGTAVSDVSITVAGASQPATEPARLLEVQIGDRRIDRNPLQPGCLTVAQVDGEPVRVRPTAPVTEGAFLASPCGEPTALDAGPHEWVSSAEFTSDLVVWSDDASTGRTPGEPDVVDIAGDAAGPGRPPGPGWSGTLPERSEDLLLVAGVGHDPGWSLSADGVDVGPPLLMNGYAAAWVVPPGDSASLSLSYGPQWAAVVGLALSGVALLAAAGVLVTRRRAMAADLHTHDVLTGAFAPAPEAARPPSDAAGRPPIRSRGRGLLVSAGWILIGGAVLGVIGIVAAAVGLVIRGFRRKVAAVVLTSGWAVVTAAWFWETRDLRGSVTPDLVASSPVASSCAGAVVIASVVWAFGREKGGP